VDDSESTTTSDWFGLGEVGSALVVGFVCFVVACLSTLRYILQCGHVA
jgi:hypothetical protein